MFLNEEHKNKYNILKKKCDCYNHSELNALLYVIAGNESLYSKRSSIYNFSENRLKLKFNDEGEPDFSGLYLSSSARALLNLGIQMYNNGSSQNVFETFCYLDEDNSKLAINCIKMRFNIE